jgi:protein-arginine kinase
LFIELTGEDLNRATLLVMPAHLQKQAKKEMNETELSIARAERVRELLMRKRPKRTAAGKKR